MKNGATFRRRRDRLMWHTNPNCERWPLMDYVEDSPTGPMAHLMICTKCRLLDDELVSSVNSERISKLSRTEKQ